LYNFWFQARIFGNHFWNVEITASLGFRGSFFLFYLIVLEIQSIVDKMNNMRHATRVIAKKNCLKSISLAGGVTKAWGMVCWVAVLNTWLHNFVYRAEILHQKAGGQENDEGQRWSGMCFGFSFWLVVCTLLLV